MNTIGRRRFLKTAGAAAAGAMAGCRIRPREAEREEAVPTRRPNFLVILADDLGYGDLSAYGATDLRSPNIDRLIGEGMRFDYGYANCPVCSPTRAALLSGRYPEMVGVPGVIRTHQNNSWGYLSPNATLLPMALGRAGYKTACVGKWHLGLEVPNIPNTRGFDFYHGFLGDMMDDYYTHRRHGINYMRRDREVIDPEGHATDLFTQWACEYLREQSGSDSPFFLYLAYNAPHTPIQPPDEWLAKVKERVPGIDDRRARLVALIEHMDHGIGQVLDTLRETGLDENTVVVFASDNGGQTGVGADNGPLRAGKGTLYEGGIRVPMAVRWPGRIEAGSRSERIVLTMDWMPTLLEAAGVATDQVLDGRSILRTVTGKPQPVLDRDLFWGRREGGKFAGGYISAIRRGDWKLLQPMPEEPYELYNLATDPLEEEDLAGKQPEKFGELKKALEAQLARYAEVPWRPPELRG